MQKISLTQGRSALVDDKDYAWLSKWKWHCTEHGYARRCGYPEKSPISMHREILGLQKGDRKIVDHKNGNKLDNRRSNLRLCTFAQNIRNSSKRKTTANPYKG